MGTTQSTLEDDGDRNTEIKKVKEIKFHVQDVQHVVSSRDVDPSTSLNYYLRNMLHMSGTKGMCYEGGCGACVVVLQSKDPVTQKDIFLAVNSCLVPLLSCNNLRISTVEGIGNPLKGYHPIQEILAKFNGTQCGFCSPGMVMNMYALYQSGKLTMEQVENSFSGNICRCTGYRSILSAFKALCTDASPEILGEYPDIEDLRICGTYECVESCPKECVEETKESFYLPLKESKWIKVHSLRDLLLTINLNPKRSRRLVAGNTGVYKSYKKSVELYIDITDVPELKLLDVKDDSCILGANTTLTNTIEFFNQVAKKYPDQFAYLKAMADHIDLVANVPVRNRATLAGNLMIKHDYREFPSDIFLILETVGAQLTIVNLLGVETKLSPLEFITHDLNLSVLKTITLGSYSDKVVKYVSYKIMPRAQNTHAHVNSGFLFKFGASDTIKSATIVFGNINNTFVHATKSEKLLAGKKIFTNSVLKKIYDTLSTELTPDVRPPDPSPKFRKQLAIALFYKAILSIAPDNKLSAKNKSGGALLKRPISTGAQDYETNKSMYPLTQAIPKIEALAQTSGEAQYIDDIPDLPYQLFGALVLAEAPPNSTIKKINASKALANKDIVAFYSKEDIPGDNSFTPIMDLINTKEELFCSGVVLYYQQPLGVLVGKSQEAVEQASTLVEITYDAPNMEPLITVRQILKNGRDDRIDNYKTINRSKKGNDTKHVLKGTFDIYHQYHFHMETQTCNVVPTEQGLDVFSATQWMDLIQYGIAEMLNIQISEVNVITRRCGGGFGGKISRSGLVGCAAALPAWKLKRPVKLCLPLTINMVALGKRWPLSMDYEVGVNDNGVIQYLTCSYYTDAGAIADEDPSKFIEKVFTTTYASDTFQISCNRAITDTPTNTWARGPGSTEGIAAIESIMEHISYAINIDPLDLRMANLPDNSPIAKYITDIKVWANIDERKKDIIIFNKENRWKKKGLAVAVMKFDVILTGPFLVTVAICHGDGSVQISHGGIEIGQGINTKAAQVCAYKFNIPLKQIKVLPSNSFVSANSATTGGSITSDAVCYGVDKACDELLARIKPYRENGLLWPDVIKKCHEDYVNLVATGNYAPNASDVHPYAVYGICATEVLVDILTGQHLVTRVDLIEDTGITLSPIVDIGQAEGAFVMGLGYNTMEKLVFNYEGKILTNNTWTYYPPGAKDIPIDFRVKFPKDNPNPIGVLKSKGTGEPALCLAITIPFAIRNALASARVDAAASNPKWYLIDGPTDVENVFLNSCNDYSQYVL